MGSRRLPGKVLMDLGGRSVLERVVQRLERAQSLTAMVVATTARPEEAPILDLCARRGWQVYRGSEHDVLDRYHGAAQVFQADIVVRVTSDCPLIDPVLVDAVVAALQESGGVDYASNTLEPRTYPRGLDVEAFTFAALERAWREDANCGWREHVTPYIYRNPNCFRLRVVRHGSDLSAMRWTLDTPEDLRFLRLLIEVAATPYASWQELVRVVEANPDLADVNRGVVQKRIDPNG